MTEHECAKCGLAQPPGNFYVDSGKRGHGSTCKMCCAARVAAYRAARPEWELARQKRYRERNREKRRAANRASRAAHRDQVLEYQRQRRANEPIKVLAWSAVSRAVRTGKLIRPSACGDCGAESRIEAHHPDYTKPLEVLWLCKACHVKADALTRTA